MKSILPAIVQIRTSLGLGSGVVFDARGDIRQDASGKLVQVEGAFVVRVRMQNALDADLTKSTAPRTYSGPLRFSPHTPEIVELVKTGGFEAVLTWVVGVRDRVDFRVITLRSPARLVVDFRNH